MIATSKHNSCPSSSGRGSTRAIEAIRGWWRSTSSSRISTSLTRVCSKLSRLRVSSLCLVADEVDHMKDMEKLEHDYLHYGQYTFSYSVKRMERKEAIFNGSNIFVYSWILGKKVDKVAIIKEKLQAQADLGKFTYPGWRSDLEKVIANEHYCISAEIKLMKKKQCYHVNGVLPDKRLEKVRVILWDHYLSVADRVGQEETKVSWMGTRLRNGHETLNLVDLCRFRNPQEVHEAKTGCVCEWSHW